MCNENKKNKRLKRCVIERKINFVDYRKQNGYENEIICLGQDKIDVASHIDSHEGLTENNKFILKKQQRFRSEKHNVFTKESKKIALNSDDDKRIQPID